MPSRKPNSAPKDTCDASAEALSVEQLADELVDLLLFSDDCTSTLKQFVGKHPEHADNLTRDGQMFIPFLERLYDREDGPTPMVETRPGITPSRA